MRLQRSAGNRAVTQRMAGRGQRPGDSLPTGLRQGLEAVSGIDMADVRLHRDAAEPATLGALAFTQGQDIYLAPGQERHLPHEAWHVVQQKQRRVPATCPLPGGRTANTDPRLEEEAQRMGVTALGRAGESVRGAPARAVADPHGPLQGVFEYLGETKPKAEGEKKRWVWKDSDTGVYYFWKRSGPLGGVVPETGVHAFVTVWRQDGFSLQIRPGDQAGHWVPIETEEAQSLRKNLVPFEPVRPVEPPTMVPSDDRDTLMVEEAEPMTATFTQSGERQPAYEQQAQAQLMERGYRNARLETDFTVQVDVLPLTQGKPRYLEQPEPGADPPPIPRDYVYTAEQVAASRVEVGDKDRPNTYLEPEKGKSHIAQGRHTVAWAFLRRSMMAMGGRPLSEVLDHFITAFAHTEPLIGVGEGRHLLVAINYPTGLTSLRGAAVPIDVWQRALSELVRVYAQVYHLSEGALFRGRSTQRGEHHGVMLLAANEDALGASGPLTVTIPALTKAAADLLDVNFTIPPRTYAFAVHHWLELLAYTYPRVMQAHGAGIVASQLDKPVTSSYPRQTDASVKQVRDLLAFYSYTLPDFARVALPQPATGELAIAPFPFTDLKSSLVASVTVLPARSGQPAQYTVQFGIPTTLQVLSYVPADLEVGEVTLSDLDRPQTKSGRVQQSHSVAWTLVRHDIMSHHRSPLGGLLKFLERSLTTLRKDIAPGRTEAQKLVADALAALAEHDKRRMPLHDWQALASMVVKWYAHAYQVSESATFFDARTHWRPEGHAEGVHMAVLRRNEAALVDDGRLVDTPARVTEAAAALIDAYVGATGAQERFVVAFDHWLSALTHAFPRIVAAGKEAILAKVGEKNIGTKESPVSFATILKGRI